MANNRVASKCLTLIGALVLLGALGQPVWAQSTTAAPASDEANKQAAYCIEASSSLLQQTIKFIASLKEHRAKGQAFLADPATSPSDRAEIGATLKRTDDDIAAHEKNRAAREADVKVFIGYLERTGVIKGRTKPALVEQMSAEVRKDQQEAQAIYTGCARACAANDAACRKTCTDKADSSEARKRMDRCAEIVGRFKG